MKKIILVMGLVSAFMLVGAARSEEMSATIPSEVTLKSGAVLRKVTVVRFEKDRVILKHAGGVDPVRFDVLATGSAKAFSDYLAEQAKPRTYRGSIFVVTKGAGSYKMGNVQVFIVPLAKNRAKQLMPTLAEDSMPAGAKMTRTDSDGRFQFKWQGTDTFTICIFAKRLAGGDTELYNWIIERAEITDPDDIQLSNHNMIGG